MFEDGLGQRRPDAGRPREVLDSGAQHTLQTAELPEQRAASRGSESGNRFQHRGLARPRAAPAMAADREPVRLVARALDQVQCLRVGRKYRGRLAVQQE